MRISDWSSDVCSSDLEHVVVALVEADRGLVEDVEHARQAAADLRREPDALRFAARERAAGAIEVEIIEPDIVEEAAAFEDLLESAIGDVCLLRGEIGGEGSGEGRWGRGGVGKEKS